ncbi:hypothetical protein L7F22_043455 [Adiantum nelumboides]|nr:hypothetical protein [Adiantum nelumboides]
MAMALLCRKKGLFRYQLCGRFFSSYTGSPWPTCSSRSRVLSCSGTVPDNKCPLLAMLLSPHHFGLRRRFSAEPTSYPTPAPPGDFEDFPDAGADYESGAEDDDPPPDPEEDALYSPSESEN